MANAAEASASTARPRKKKAAQGETPAARKNGANKGTVKGREGESSRLPVNEPMTGTLFFFLDNAALVVTTVAVMELC